MITLQRPIHTSQAVEAIEIPNGLVIIGQEFWTRNGNNLVLIGQAEKMFNGYLLSAQFKSELEAIEFSDKNDLVMDYIIDNFAAGNDVDNNRYFLTW